MGVLGNLDHERFCQAVHTRTWAGEKRSAALPAAYRETMYRGDREKVADKAISPNARRLSQRKEVRDRLKELADGAAQVAELDAAWAQRKLKGYVDSKDASYNERISAIALMAKIAGWEAPKKIAPTTPDGKALNLEDMIVASLVPKAGQ